MDPFSLSTIARCFFGISQEDLDQIKAKTALEPDAAVVRLLSPGQLARAMLKQAQLRAGVVGQADVSRLLTFAARGATKVAGQLDATYKALARHPKLQA